MRTVYDSGMDKSLSYEKRMILSRINRSILSTKRYPIRLTDKIVIRGNEIHMETKLQAIKMIEELNMPDSFAYFKTCIKKLEEEKCVA